MAEAAGLTIGALALASLFSTCIELVDCFELARNHVYEYNLACTKIGLLRARLSVWGNELSLEMPGHEHPALRDSWPREREAISCGLFNIKALFEDASLLRDKYDLSPQHPRALKPVIPRRLSWFKTGSKGSTSLTVTKLASLRRRTVWAIHDKQKFDSFIQNLSFLIENLEKVTKRIKMPTPQKETEAGEYSSNTLRKLVPKPQDQEKPSDQKDVRILSFLSFNITSLTPRNRCPKTSLIYLGSWTGMSF